MHVGLRARIGLAVKAGLALKLIGIAVRTGFDVLGGPVRLPFRKRWVWSLFIHKALHAPISNTSTVAILAAAVVLIPCVVCSQEPLPHAIVFDPYMTPAAGAQGLLTVQRLFAAAEDRWLPRKVGQERSRPALALGILYRSAKFLALDVPQDHMLMVVAHEVFGHGARFRELGDGRIGYGFDAPIPYGDGEAFTSFRGSFPISPLASLSVSASGIEAQHALADAITERAVARGRIHYREAWLYFESRITGMSYILTASPHSEAGHDVADFLGTFQEACTSPCAPHTRKYVQRRALLALADPLLYYAMYGVAASYVGAGNPTGPLPMIPIGRSVRVLPSLGFALTPYGAEWTARGGVQRGERDEGRGQRGPGITLTSVALRVGDTGASTTWGVGVRAADVVRVLGLRVDAAIDVWRQPPLFADATSSPLRSGAGATTTVVVPLPRPFRSRWVRGIHVTAGYKSQGYIPGEQLSGGGVLRAGIQLR